MDRTTLGNGNRGLTFAPGETCADHSDDSSEVAAHSTTDLERIRRAVREILLAVGENPDREGLRDDAASKSWNSSHPSRACDTPSLVATGGAGLLYCFAAN